MEAILEARVKSLDNVGCVHMPYESRGGEPFPTQGAYEQPFGGPYARGKKGWRQKWTEEQIWLFPFHSRLNSSSHFSPSRQVSDVITVERHIPTRQNHLRRTQSRANEGCSMGIVMGVRQRGPEGYI